MEKSAKGSNNSQSENFSNFAENNWWKCLFSFNHVSAHLARIENIKMEDDAIAMNDWESPARIEIDKYIKAIYRCLNNEIG